MYRINAYYSPEELSEGLFGRPIERTGPAQRKLILAIESDPTILKATAEAIRDLDEATSIEALVGIRDGAWLPIDPRRTRSRLVDNLSYALIDSAARKLLVGHIDPSPILALTAATSNDPNHESVAPPIYIDEPGYEDFIARDILSACSAGIGNHVTRKALAEALAILLNQLDGWDEPLHEPRQCRTDTEIRYTVEDRCKATHRPGARISYKRAYYHAYQAIRALTEKTALRGVEYRPNGLEGR